MGKGTKVLRVPLKTAISGTNFKFVLAFGSLQEFDSKQQKTKEITGIEITKEAEKISVEDLDKKSIELTINENTNVLTLLGDPKYESVKIISTKGAIIDQYFNTNKFNTKSLPKGSYFVVTDTGYYFKFNKNN